jgi:hypothetical protein
MRKDTMNETMYLDAERLRKDIKNDLYGAYFSAGFGAAMVTASEVDQASAQKLIKIAERLGIDLNKYLSYE